MTTQPRRPRQPKEAPEAPSPIPVPGFWFWPVDAKISNRFGNLLLRDAKLGMQNYSELSKARRYLQVATNSLNSDDIPLPDGFLAPRLALPNKGFAPDYFSYGSDDFASHKLREALAQPPDVVQFTPVDLVAGGEAARAQDYRLMRVLVRQKAMDLDRSECELAPRTNRITGEAYMYPEVVTRFALLDGLRADIDIFRMDELPASVLVTDALAARVLQVGCTGMEFADPGNLQWGMRVERYRTAHGIAERRVGFLD